jgi:hypothetical protein
MVKNYLNMDFSQRNLHIYRIICIDKLLQMFRNSENILVKPKKWDDPFENFILNSKFEIQKGKFANFSLRNKFYGQCWTRKTSSDAMWRIYSPNSKSVRIRTTIEKLFNSLSSTLGEFSHIQCFIGKVRYLNNSKLMNFAETIFTGANLFRNSVYAETLLVKRPAFRHEGEIRLLYMENGEASNNDIFSYKIDPQFLIDQIMIDPRVSYSEFKEIKSMILNETGFKKRILRSLLYAPPEKFIFPYGFGYSTAHTVD